jgi:hypothetical protein
VDFIASPTTQKEGHMASTLALVTLSTGRTISAGIHCFSSAVNADGSEMERAAWAPLTDAESAEAWDIVNARCRAYRAAR